MRILSICITLLFSLLCSALQSQKLFAASLDMLDGSTRNVQIKFPLDSNKSNLNIVSENGEAEKIACDDISGMIVTTPNGTEAKFLNIQYALYIKGYSDTKVGKNKVWQMRAYACDELEYYLGAQKYIINKEGNLIAKSSGTVPMIGHYLKRSDEDVSTWVDTTADATVIMIGGKKAFVQAVAAYLSDSPDLAQRVTDGEFKKKSITVVLDEYCK